MAVIYGTDDRPVEIGPGRGDLRYSSTPLDLIGGGSIPLVGGRGVSFARLYSEQVWIAITVMRLLTWSIRVPLKVYKRTGENDRVRLRPPDHRLAAGIETPWDLAGRPQLVMALLGSLAVNGNGTMDVEDGPKKIRFRDLKFGDMRAILHRKEIAGWKHVVEGEEDPLPRDRVIHVKYWAPEGPFGISPLQQLGTSIAIDDAAQRWQVQSLRNSGRPPSAITADEKFLGLKKDDRDQLLAKLRKQIDTIYAGPENAGRPALLPPGLTWEKVGHTAVEAELIAQRKVSREEAASLFMIPPPMVGLLERATFSNIAELRQVAYTDGLGPPLVLIEEAINAHVIRHLLREDDVYVEFDFAKVLRGDRLREIQALREAISGGLMKPNEGRTALNLPEEKVDGADRLYLPKNNLSALGEDDALEETTREDERRRRQLPPADDDPDDPDDEETP